MIHEALSAYVAALSSVTMGLEGLVEQPAGRAPVGVAPVTASQVRVDAALSETCSRLLDAAKVMTAELWPHNSSHPPSLKPLGVSRSWCHWNRCCNQYQGKRSSTVKSVQRLRP